MALWRARDVAVNISSSSLTSAAGFTSATDYSGYFKSVEFKEPERNTGEVKLLGSTSGNANSEIYEEDPTTAELTGEFILTPNDSSTPVDLADFFYGTADSINYAADPSNPSIFIQFGDDTDYVGFILQDVTLNTLGGLKVDADGHATGELKVTAAANKTFRVKGGAYSTAP